MLYVLYRIATFLTLKLPLKLCYWLADISGSIYYLLARKDKKIVADNLRVVLRQGERRRKISHISRMVFVNFSRYLVDFFRAGKVDSRYLEKNVKVCGRDNLEKALTLNKGVLLVSAHLGNWELGAMVLSILGYKINSVAWTHQQRKINDFFLGQRQGKGIKVIPLGMGIRKAFSALEKNEMVALLGDIDFLHPDMGVRIKLFGQDTIIPQGPAVFSLKTGCPIVPLFMIREKGSKFSFFIEEPIIYRPSQNRQSDIVNLTEKVGRAIEVYIGRYPEQWFMPTPRWRQAKN